MHIAIRPSLEEGGLCASALYCACACEAQKRQEVCVSLSGTRLSLGAAIAQPLSSEVRRQRGRQAPEALLSNLAARRCAGAAQGPRGAGAKEACVDDGRQERVAGADGVQHLRLPLRGLEEAPAGRPVECEGAELAPGAEPEAGSAVEVGPVRMQRPQKADGQVPLLPCLEIV